MFIKDLYVKTTQRYNLLPIKWGKIQKLTCADNKNRETGTPYDTGGMTKWQNANEGVLCNIQQNHIIQRQTDKLRAI